MLDGRKRFSVGLAAAAVVGISLLPSTPAQAEPDVDDVRAQVEDLYHASEQAAERRNDAELELERLTQELALLQADERAQAAGFDTVREQVADAVVAQSQGTGVSPLAEAALSEDTAGFLAQMSTIASYNDVQGRIVDTYTTELQALEIRREATEQRVEQIRAVEERAAAESREIDANVAEAEELLQRLEAEEQAEIFAAEATTTDPGEAAEIAADVPDVPVSGRAAAAVQYALAQVGDSYVYGASGPNAFDCSGLTSMAWAQAGVSLPHSSSAQYSSGRKVGRDELQPGDLVFYYSPISHVGIYIGGGQIVHAANPRSGVAVTGVGSMPYTGAVRPG
ncbi:NlpC/P60 family protein [Nocardioides sp. CPCC 205120]|uniref:C40 family peptidase n=1 Tax=Nocardioides sp. CPCC 205120 TaxID=3406462 RepID=UPI003B504F19